MCINLTRAEKSLLVELHKFPKKKEEIEKQYIEGSSLSQYWEKLQNEIRRTYYNVRKGKFVEINIPLNYDKVEPTYFIKNSEKLMRLIKQCQIIDS